MEKKGRIKKRLKIVKSRLRIATALGIIAIVLFIAILINPDFSILKDSFVGESKTEVSAEGKIENGIHVSTGFIAKDGYKTVIQNCTSCHSSQLVIQNRMNKDRWNATIKWMQETQNLRELGDSQNIIVNYLVSNYPPVKKGRRANLDNIEWYDLKK